MPHGIGGDTCQGAMQADAVAAAVGEDHVLDQVPVDSGREGAGHLVFCQVEVNDMAYPIPPGEDLSGG